MVQDLTTGIQGQEQALASKDQPLVSAGVTDILRHIIHETNETLASAVTVFSGDKLILSRSKLIYVKHSWLSATSVKTLAVTDILNVTGSAGPLWGTITVDHTAQNFPTQFGFFWRHEGIRLKRIIDGYVIALRQGVDLSGLTLDRLIPILIELGTDDATVR